jgi:hypothetical protein
VSIANIRGRIEALGRVTTESDPIEACRRAALGSAELQAEMARELERRAQPGYVPSPPRMPAPIDHHNPLYRMIADAIARRKQAEAEAEAEAVQS